MLKRPLDPAQPQGKSIDIHFVVVPAMARNKQPDALFFFAGGPGQSAIALAAPVYGLLARLNNRRDIVFIDQRGTGKSAPLVCKTDKADAFAPLADAINPSAMKARLAKCIAELQTLPYGDTRQFHTSIAMQDADAVRAALGYPQINVVGGSYGTRAVLDYMRQFPKQVRRAVIDGVAPPDMVLPESFSPDMQSAMDQVFDSCAKAPSCNARYPNLRATWKQLLASLPRQVTVMHPVLGRQETLTLEAASVLNLVRQPLYAPPLASALPYAITEAAAGRFAPLFGVASAMSGGSKATQIAMGMHFAVVCAEDVQRVATTKDSPGADFGRDFGAMYAQVCANLPKATVPDAFYTIPAAPAATLVLSGGADPVTPPRHGERTAKALGANARHIVVPQAGHGVMSIGCTRDALFRFINAASDVEALAVDMSCMQQIPRPAAFAPLEETK